MILLAKYLFESLRIIHFRFKVGTIKALSNDLASLTFLYNIEFLMKPD